MSLILIFFQAAKSERMCFSCKGSTCKIIRTGSTNLIEFCAVGVKECYINNKNFERGCKTATVETTKVCGEDLCNDEMFSQVCYNCGKNDQHCAVPDDQTPIIECDGVFECFTHKMKDNSVERGCSFGYVPMYEFCSTALCNNEPMLIDACYVYYAKLINTYNLVRPIEKDWVEHSCPKRSDRPFCYMVITPSYIEGGCSAMVENFEAKLSGPWAHEYTIFCDTPYCNYNQIRINE